jgi:hypothetical protein
MLGGYSYSDISGEKTEDNFAGEDYWIVKTDGSGAIQWQHTIGANGIDQLYSIRQTTDGGFIMGGFSNSNISGDKTENTNGGFDYWIVKTDIIGNILWENNIGGANFDMFIDLQQTADGGYILAGRSSSNISGDKTENSNGGWDYWIVKLAPESTTPAAILPDFFPKITISPNPASTQLTFSCHTAPVLELDIVNVMGEKVETVLVGNQLESRIIDISRLPAGVYFALIKTTVGHSTIRFAKVE